MGGPGWCVSLGGGDPSSTRAQTCEQTMLIEFNYRGHARVILIPENARDKQLLQLFASASGGVRLIHAPSATPEALIFESYEEGDKPNAINIHERGPQED